MSSRDRARRPRTGPRRMQRPGQVLAAVAAAALVGGTGLVAFALTPALAPAAYGGAADSSRAAAGSSLSGAAASGGSASGDAPTGSPMAAATPAASEPPKPRAVFIGDSYTAGFGSSDDSATFPSLVAAREGWDEVNLGQGGTGYDTSAGIFGCGEDFCPAYEGVIPQARELAPDLIVVSGGTNDVWADEDELSDAVSSFYSELRDTFPDARIIATSPVAESGDAPSPELDALSDSVAASVTAVGGEFLDLDQPLEGHPELFGDDDVHPNDDGYAAIAAAIVAALPPVNQS